MSKLAGRGMFGGVRRCREVADWLVNEDKEEPLNECGYRMKSTLLNEFDAVK